MLSDKLDSFDQDAQELQSPSDAQTESIMKRGGSGRWPSHNTMV